MRILEADFTCYGLDLPGHGASSYVPCDGVEDYASVVLEFLEAEDLREVVLVGHSMGGAISLKVVPFTRRVGALVLVGTGAKLGVNPKLLSLFKQNFPEALVLMARWSFLKEAPKGLLDRAVEMAWRCGQTVLLQDFRACDRYSARGELHRIQVPALVVCGRQDLMTPPDLSKELVRDIKGARLALIEGCGHMVPMERPEDLAGAIRAFVGEVNPPKGNYKPL